MVDNDFTPEFPATTLPVPSLPGAALLDEAIEAHLAAFDAVPPEVRRYRMDLGRAGPAADARGRAAGAGLRASGRSRRRLILDLPWRGCRRQRQVSGGGPAFCMSTSRISTSSSARELRSSAIRTARFGSVARSHRRRASTTSRRSPRTWHRSSRSFAPSAQSPARGPESA